MFKSLCIFVLLLFLEDFFLCLVEAEDEPIECDPEDFFFDFVDFFFDFFFFFFDFFVLSSLEEESEEESESESESDLRIAKNLLLSGSPKSPGDTDVVAGAVWEAVV